MKAIAIVPGTRALHHVERPEPRIETPHQLKLQVLQVGICGTDREEGSAGRSEAPPGARDLVIGHELLGTVVETGSAITRFRKGDFAVFTVRRGCGTCLPCAMNRSDMCTTGRYRERGIDGLDGYQAEFVVDDEQYAVNIPRVIAPVGVLTEPLSIVEKAIDEAVRLQFARLPAAMATPMWLYDRPCLVAGLGPIGLLAAMVLRLRGARVFGLDIVDAESARPRWLESIGGHYLNARAVPPDRIRQEAGPMMFVFEAAGAPRLAFNLLDALDYNGVYVLTGIPSSEQQLQIPAGELIRGMVLSNQAMIGSVNASRGHFQMAVDDLLNAHYRWPGHIAKLITHRFPVEEVERAVHEHTPDEIKTIIEWRSLPAPRGG